MNAATGRIISIYLWLHLLLMLVKSLIIWLPVFFILYGGIQAVVLLTMLNKKPLSFSVGDMVSCVRYPQNYEEKKSPELTSCKAEMHLKPGEKSSCSQSL